MQFSRTIGQNAILAQQHLGLASPSPPILRFLNPLLTQKIVSCQQNLSLIRILDMALALRWITKLAVHVGFRLNFAHVLHGFYIFFQHEPTFVQLDELDKMIHAWTRLHLQSHISTENTLILYSFSRYAFLSDLAVHRPIYGAAIRIHILHI